MAEIPGWDEEIHGAIKALVRLVGDRLDLLTTSDDHSAVRQCAAAYLARVRRLVIGMDVLFEAGMPDIMGGIMRICWEQWVTGMWVLFVGEDALDALEAHYRRESNRRITAAEMEVDLLDEIEGPTLPKPRKRVEVVEAHLVAEGDATPDELLWTHDLVYTSESALGIHAGVSSVLLHLVEQSGRTGVSAVPQEPHDGSGKLLWVAPLLAMLARRVFIEFGIQVEDLDELAAPLNGWRSDSTSRSRESWATNSRLTTTHPGGTVGV